jgi:SET domain-containing protein
MTAAIKMTGPFDLKVRRSSAGLGLYAGEDIAKGARVIEYEGRVLTAEEEETSRSKYLFEISSRKTIDGSDRANVARYINHSCKPNCEPIIKGGRVFIYAKRTIKEGEELVYNYGERYFEDIIKPMGCRCVKCMPAAHEAPTKKRA